MELKKYNNLLKGYKTQVLAFIFRPRLSTSEQIFFIKRLSFLMSANIPILESLSMILEQTKSTQFKKIILTAIEDMSNGKQLSASLRIWKGVFSDYTLNIIYFAESSGTLSENLEYIALELEKRNTLKKKIISAFIYPALVTGATLCITLFLVVYLFPKIMPVFKSLRMELPFSTRIVMFTSTLIREDGFLIAGLLLTLCVCFVVIFKKVEKIRFFFHRNLFKIPLIGKIFQYYELTNVTRTLGLLLKSGLSLTDALPITQHATGNIIYKHELGTMNEYTTRGEKMSLYMETRKVFFPIVITQIVAVGEKSGNLSESLVYVSELYEREVDDFTHNLSNLIEPLLMITLGVLVGFIAISIITPIYSITQNLHQ
ncbi:MAG: type II secretion system F family protein [Candidatus Zambryskibacteria bacterium]|nr:type II secretion system F family protein [Candidatus Zambryskibacteria bacterium]